MLEEERLGLLAAAAATSAIRFAIRDGLKFMSSFSQVVDGSLTSFCFLLIGSSLRKTSGAASFWPSKL